MAHRAGTSIVTKAIMLLIGGENSMISEVIVIDVECGDPLVTRSEA